MIEDHVNIHVVIPSYNCSEWIERCLASLASQTHAPASVVVIDDASTDPEYGPIAEALCTSYGYTYHRNEVNRKCPYNLRLGIDMLDAAPEDVIFLLDGDDFLPHDRVFARYAQFYRKEWIWLTYGNYEPYPVNTGQTLAFAYPKEVVRARSFRTAQACFNHPITFRKHLWDHITDADMQTADGEWFTGGYDMVIIAPMLELSTPYPGQGMPHWRFINEPLYMYNAVNPLSDSIVNVGLIEESREMMQRPIKEPL